MNKNTCKSIQLGKGEMHIYDFGGVRLHAYQTHDLIDDEVFLLEKDGKVLVLESPCFFDNIAELTAYLEERGLEPAGILVSYHAAGASFLPGVPKYATRGAAEYSAAGGGRALIDGFAAAFGPAFDHAVHQPDHFLEEGPVTIGGIEFVIHPTAEAFDVEIPEINAVYTHMLGHDCHSIVAGAGHADAMIAQLEGCIARGYDLILTSHYTPEDQKDARTKIDYLKELKVLAAASADRGSFKAAVGEKYPQYSGENYLDMTAGFFFP